MLDLGLAKLAVISVVALVVVGPERLPRVARTMGALFGRAQRYVNEVKAEVTREIELEELKQLRTHVKQTAQDIESALHEAGRFSSEPELADHLQTNATLDSTRHNSYSPPSWALNTPIKKSWRTKRSALPRWYKQTTAKRLYVQSGAARVARHRPANLRRSPTRFFR